MTKGDDALDGSHLILNGTPKTVAIDAVRPHPENYRNGDITGIGDSIEANKLYKRLIVQKSTGYILAGTHTWLAAQQKGLKVIPIEEHDVDDDHARRILAVDNRESDKATNDEEKLAALLRTIGEKDEELTGTGWTPDEFADMFSKSEEVTSAPPQRAPRKPKTNIENYFEQFGVLVICSDDEHRRNVLEQLREDGLNCKPIGD